MVVCSGSHSRSQVSVANPWVDRHKLVTFKCHRRTGWSKWLSSVRSSWYSAIANSIASNGGSTSSTSQQHRAGSKARLESWAMFREDHVRNLVASKQGYCKSRIFRMHFIFVYFVRGGFRTKR